MRSRRSWLLLLQGEQEALFHASELDIIAGCPRRWWNFVSAPLAEPLTGQEWVTCRQVLIQMLIPSGSHIWKIQVVGKEKKMKRGMGILHHPFLSELGKGGMLKIGTGALEGQRARNAMAEAHQSCRVLGTPGMGWGQEFTAIPKVGGATCGLTSLKGHPLLCMSPTPHKEGCWWDLTLNLAAKTL